MNKKPFLLCVVALIFCMGASYGAEVLTPQPVNPDEFPEITFKTTGKTFPLSRTWKYIADDNKEYASPNFDDSTWQDITVGNSKHGGAWSWYRLTFELPQYLQNKNLLLDLGRISVYDEVYVNGEMVGKFGNPPPNFVHGASDVWRKYPIAAEHFHPGKNVIAVRVYPGYKGRMYEGDYTLQALAKDVFRVRLNLKIGGANSLRTLLTKAVHLNDFAPGKKLLIAPDVSKLFGAPEQGKLAITLLDGSGKIYAQDAAPIALKPQYWTRTLFSFTAPSVAAEYKCHLVYSVNGEVRWEEEIPFRVKTPVSLDFALKVDTSLQSLENKSFPVQVSEVAMGHFGPRDSHVVNGEIELFDDTTLADSRSGLAYSAYVEKSTGAPQLFLANTRPVPVDANKVPKMHRAPGYKYDGMYNSWMYGFVRPNRAGKIESLAVKSISWAKRTWHYEYKTADQMDFSISAISPAWVATSNSRKMRVFEGIEKHGIGLPTYLAYQSKSGIKVIPATAGIDGADMTANWVLAWFNGGQGWEEFDTPYLFVLQKRPERVRTYAHTALFFGMPEGESIGTIQGMPLYGVTMLRPDQTADWKQGLPADVAERCQYWSRVLVNAPDEVTRTAQVDYANDQLTVKDEFTYLNIQDDWNTQGIKIAPISPVLALAAHAGNIDIATSKATKDLHMTTLQGPLCVAEDATKVLFRVNGILHYIRQVREVQITDSAAFEATKAKLNQLVREWMDEELKQHPWKSGVRAGKLEPGTQRLRYTGLILTLPYLEPALRAEVKQEIRTETEKYFLYTGLPDEALKKLLRGGYKTAPVNSIVTNPETGLQLATTALAEKNFGIDQVYFTALDVYMMWMYGAEFDRFDWLKTKYPLLKKYYNLTRNSHDWDIGVSWDTFSGFRVGSGLQESGGIFSGMVGMARIAHQLGDESTFNAASYYAVMEAVGMQGQVAASEYLEQRRPWLITNTNAAGIEYAQKIHSRYYAELDAFVGISQVIIGLGAAGASPGSFIESPLPELMRLYQEVWTDFTNDFYDPKYDKRLNEDRRIDWRVYMDTFVYQISEYPQTIDQVFAARKDLEIDLWHKVTDYRGYLDSKGKIEYRELW